jgi:hypothetical protein
LLSLFFALEGAVLGRVLDGEIKEELWVRRRLKSTGLSSFDPESLTIADATIMLLLSGDCMFGNDCPSFARDFCKGQNFSKSCTTSMIVFHFIKNKSFSKLSMFIKSGVAAILFNQEGNCIHTRV